MKFKKNRKSLFKNNRKSRVLESCCFGDFGRFPRMHPVKEIISNFQIFTEIKEVTRMFFLGNPSKTSVQPSIRTPAQNCLLIFSFATWLPQSQLWNLDERTSLLTLVNYCLLFHFWPKGRQETHGEVGFFKPEWAHGAAVKTVWLELGTLTRWVAPSSFLFYLAL